MTLCKDDENELAIYIYIYITMLTVGGGSRVVVWIQFHLKITHLNTWQEFNPR